MILLSSVETNNSDPALLTAIDKNDSSLLTRSLAITDRLRHSMLKFWERPFSSNSCSSTSLCVSMIILLVPV